eukprot:2284500-Ditylum_brightwellii.AAC.1
MLCAGGGDTDACKGDSGSPILYKDNEEFVQIGIVSWGRGCGSGNSGVYADVRTERAWIDETICNNSANSVASRCSPQTTKAASTITLAATSTNAPTQMPA